MTTIAALTLTAIAISKSTAEASVPGSENGLIVAVGGVIGITLFLTIILLRVLKKRKQSMR